MYIHIYIYIYKLSDVYRVAKPQRPLATVLRLTQWSLATVLRKWGRH